MIQISLPIYNYLGIPWVMGGRDLDGFDCWGLLWIVYKNEFNTSIDEYPELNTESTKDVIKEVKKGMGKWEKLDKSENGCAVAMGRGNFINHVGIYWNRGVLHTSSLAGFSIYTPIHNLDFNIFGYYKWLG